MRSFSVFSLFILVLIVAPCFGVPPSYDYPSRNSRNNEDEYDYGKFHTDYENIWTNSYKSILYVTFIFCVWLNIYAIIT